MEQTANATTISGQENRIPAFFLFGPASHMLKIYKVITIKYFAQPKPPLPEASTKPIKWRTFLDSEYAPWEHGRAFINPLTL
tara:strand:+ start:235 stop:480 length:246 start_codon:yes stop_codon:yes gene_type:complete